MNILRYSRGDRSGIHLRVRNWGDRHCDRDFAEEE
jgi:hypothetical protein